MKNVAELEKLIIFSVAELHKEMFNRANKAFDKEGFPIQVEQLPVLMCCYYKGDLSQQEIADFASRDKSSIQRTVTYFVKHDLAKIVADVADKRKNIVRLTDEGNRLGKIIEDHVIKIDHQLFFGKLSDEDKDQFIALAGKIKKIIRES